MVYGTSRHEYFANRFQNHIQKLVQYVSLQAPYTIYIDFTLIWTDLQNTNAF